MVGNQFNHLKLSCTNSDYSVIACRQ